MQQPTNSAPVGVVGLGAMGLGIAVKLLDSGFSVIGCDVDANARRSFEDSGGVCVTTPAELAERCGIVVLVVINAEQVEAVLFGEAGLMAAPGRTGLVIQCATVAPSYSESLGTRLAEAGLPLLDAPISGGAAKSRQGRLSVMASGSADAFERAAPVLDAMAETVHRLGDAVGMGSRVKLVNQLLAGVHIAAAAEAMALGIRMGIDPEALYGVITRSAGNSWMFENRVPHILAGDYTPLSAVDIFVKDLNLVHQTGRELTFPTPLAASALQQFTAASGAGYGREDDAAVIKVYQRLAGIALPVAANDAEVPS